MTRMAASDWAANVSAVGNTENQSPIQAGRTFDSRLIGVVGIQLANCISCACSPTMTSNTMPNMSPVRINIFR